MGKLIYLPGCLFCVLVYFSSTVAADMSCYQCNIFRNGILDVCGLSERVMTNCSGCMKSYTRSYMHESWQSYKYISVVSRYCMRKGDFRLDEGCYGIQSDQGYNKRCYCYSNLCNTVPSTNSTRTHFLAIALASILLTLFVKKVLV